jgi:hypothetical protein
VAGRLPELTEEEIKDVVHLREEEKLARDVYNELYAEWGQWIFDNIAATRYNQRTSYPSVGTSGITIKLLSIDWRDPVLSCERYPA